MIPPKSPNPIKIKVSIVEDNAKLRKALELLLDASPDLQCHSVHADAEDAILNLPASPPQVLLMDINLPGISGIQCVATLSRMLPNVRIVMLTAFENSEDIYASLSAGAHGYLLKSTKPDQLLHSIRELAAGGSPISGSVARKIVDFFRAQPTTSEYASVLAPRENEVLRLLANGCPYKEIAATMNVSLGTVRTYIERIYEKLHVHNRTDAVLKYYGR